MREVSWALAGLDQSGAAELRSPQHHDSCATGAESWVGPGAGPGAGPGRSQGRGRGRLIYTRLSGSLALLNSTVKQQIKNRMFLAAAQR